jgi:para-aminobenzoate synthetase/4-amino-4-deoxychorismate lyase
VVEFALIRDPEAATWREFRNPVEVVSAERVDDVVDAIRRVEEAVETGGLSAVGFVAYEAAPAFDPALRTHDRDPRVPLVCFGLFDNARDLDQPGIDPSISHGVGEWAASQDEGGYRESVRRIRDRIAGGETYQVNHTIRLRAAFDGEPAALFRDLVRSQPDSHAAYLEIDGLVICSASPELFFSLDGDTIRSRPMKGTAARGWDPSSDRRQRAWLESSAKNRAENAMIVDMVRNDLGRVARVGTVEVVARFDVERHPTVFQMTSTVAAETTAPVSEILTALFPFASVTGAPKVRTMELISELETDPRGVYTGTIGVIEPDRRARFSAAIRTAVVHCGEGVVEYGVGSGVVWDSVAEDEYRECLEKSRILSTPPPEFDLLETLLWEPETGYSLLDRHLDRLEGAAEYFVSRPVARSAVRGLLAKRAGEFEDRAHRVRVLVACDGSIRLEASPVEPDNRGRAVRVGLASTPVRSDDPFLFFKTTHRLVYDEARRSRPDCDDVLLWNEHGEVTESTTANVVVRLGDSLVTPPVECGLLAGTFRADLLDRGEITERVITVEELGQATELLLVNSVRGWREAKLLE